MRNLLLFLVLTLSLNAEERYCIEVFSAEKKTDVTKEFIRKVSDLSLPYSQKQVDGKYKVVMGDFKTLEEALDALPEIRENVSKDAFVTVVKEEKKSLELNANAKMQQAILMAQAKMISKPVEDKTKASQDMNSTVKPVEISGPQENDKIAIQDTQIKKVSHSKAEKQAVKTKEVPKEQFCKPTKKALREEEIAQALTFYRNSSFYMFKN